MQSNAHHWTQTQIDFLRRHATLSVGELDRAFRRRFTRWAGDLTDNAIKNRRYHALRPEREAQRAIADQAKRMLAERSS